MFCATILYFKCPNISMIHGNSPSLWRIQREENRSVFLCFSKDLITSKHLTERSHFYTKLSVTKCFPKCHLIIIMSQRKENPIKCSIYNFCHSPSKTLPAKSMGTFGSRNSMCYRSTPAQEHLLCHCVSLRVCASETRGRQGWEEKQSGVKHSQGAATSLQPVRGGRGSHVHICPPECTS